METKILRKEKESKPLLEEKDTTATELNKAMATYETLTQRNHYNRDSLYLVLFYFRRLWTITSHDKGIESLKFGNKNLNESIERYFSSNTQEQKMKYCIRLARTYLKQLFKLGILSYK